jgi:predicted kinase
VMILGLPGAGKSTVAESLVARGYERLNRDEAGGSLRALLPAIACGSSRLVLDNTYVTRKARAAVIQAAWQRQLPVRCIWLTTSLEDAQLNAASRIVSRYGRLLSPEELRETAKHDTAAFAPTAQFRYQRELEPPDSSEGFAQLEAMPFDRRRDPSLINRAVIVWCDGVLWRSRSGRRTLRLRTMSRLCRDARRSCGATSQMDGTCLDCRGSPRSPTRRLTRQRSTQHSHDCESFSASRSRSSTVRTLLARLCAGAASRFRVLESFLSSVTSWILRSASTSARGRRTPGSRGGSAFSIEMQRIFSQIISSPKGLRYFATRSARVAMLSA